MYSWERGNYFTAAREGRFELDQEAARRLCALGDEDDPLVALAIGFVVRAVRGGSVCVDLSAVAEPDLDLPWPDPGAWLAAVTASDLVASPAPVLRVLDRSGPPLLYLDRYWREEEQVHADLVDRPSGREAPDEAPCQNPRRRPGRLP